MENPNSTISINNLTQEELNVLESFRKLKEKEANEEAAYNEREKTNAIEHTKSDISRQIKRAEDLNAFKKEFCSQAPDAFTITETEHEMSRDCFYYNKKLEKVELPQVVVKYKKLSVVYNTTGEVVKFINKSNFHSHRFALDCSAVLENQKTCREISYKSAKSWMKKADELSSQRTAAQKLQNTEKQYSNLAIELAKTLYPNLEAETNVGYTSNDKYGRRIITIGTKSSDYNYFKTYVKFEYKVTNGIPEFLREIDYNFSSENSDYQKEFADIKTNYLKNFLSNL